MLVQGVKYFEFSYFDFDAVDNTNKGRECLQIKEPATDSFDVTHVGSLIGLPDGNDVPHFCSTRAGTNRDNPSDPSDANADGPVRDMSVSFGFRNTNQMKVP